MFTPWSGRALSGEGERLMQGTVSLHIDYKKIYAESGTTILEAARQNGITIPTLCYHPRLKPLGHCRLCIVKIEGIDRPITSCDNPVAEGMIVTTDTPQLQKMRNQLITLALSTHPYEDCLTCVRTGTCELQDRAYQGQVELPAQLNRAIPSGTNIDNPYIVRDEEKCILCGRCIQVCRRGPGRFVYNMIGRGVNTRVVPYRDGREVTLEEAGCIFCGQCIDVCPVAALTEQGRELGGREWELTNREGVCLECSLGCFLQRRVFNGRLIKIAVPEEGDKVAWLCLKGKFGFVQEDATEPLTAVLMREKNSLVEISYNEAIEKAAEKLLQIKETKGSEALAVIASGQLSNEENYLLQKFSREVLKTPHLDLGAEPAWIRAFMKMQELAGMGISSPTPSAISNSDTILIIGKGLHENHPVAAMAVEQAGRFGNAVIIRAGSNDNDYNAAWESINLGLPAGGYQEFFETLGAISEGKDRFIFSGEPGIEGDQTARVYELINGTKSTIVVTAAFFAEATQADIEALLRLALACGCLKRGKNNLLLLSRYSNAAGVLAAGGTPCYGPGFMALENELAMSREEIISACRSGNINGLLCFGGDFSWLEEGRLDYLLTVSERASWVPQGSDLIFPAQQVWAKEGLFTNASGQTRLNESISNKANLIQDWSLICDMAKAMGRKWHYRSLQEVREEMLSLVPVSE
jgi:predicted molibdopterin-dependent oxidoreductase YjgC